MLKLFKILIFSLLVSGLHAQGIGRGAATRLYRGTGAPPAGWCDSAGDIGKVWVRSDADELYVCTYDGGSYTAVDMLASGLSGYSAVTTVGDPGSDSNIVTEQGIREALDSISTGLSCTPTRTDATNIDIASCGFIFTGMSSPIDLTNINVEVTNSNTGIIFGWVDADGEFKVGTTGGVTVTCTNCTDEGTVADFPLSAKEIFKWSVTTGSLAADDGSQDFRRTINGPLYLIDGSTTTVNKVGSAYSIEVNSSTFPAKSSHSLWFPVGGATTGASVREFWISPATVGVGAAAVGGTSPHRYIYLPYADDVDSFAIITWLVPEDWDGGTVKLTIKYILTNSDTLGNVVAWSVQTAGYGTADIVSPTYNSAQAMNSTLSSGSQRIMQTVSLSSLTMTGCTAGAICNVKIGRIGSDSDVTDTCNSSVGLLGINIRWLENLP